MEQVKTNDLVGVYDSSLAKLERMDPSAALNQLENSKCLTKAGKDWFLLATDPFHDDRLTLSGYPDTNVSGSVVQCIKQSIAISSPFGTGVSDPVWDFNLVDFPQMQHFGDSFVGQPIIIGEGPASAYLMAVNSSSSQLQGYFIGGLQGMAATTGNATFGSLPSASAQPVVGLALDSSYWNGSCRIIGKGFEVVNTTAPLYKQGQVTCYRQPVATPDSIATSIIFANNAAYTDNGVLSVWQSRQPPSTLAEAQLLEGSATWDAALGSYCVGALNTSTNPAVCPAPIVSVYTDADPLGSNYTYSGLPYQGVSTPIAGVGVPVSGDTFMQPRTSDIITPFNISGSYFTGLSPQTTLQLTYKVFVERFPDPSSTDLVVLANPSPGYDPCALELYSRTISKMPVGVPQGENSLGSWFKSVVNKVSSFATPVLKMLAPVHPALGAAAGFSGMVKNLTGNEQQAIKGRRQVNNLTDDLASIEIRRAERRERRRRKRALASNGLRPRLTTV